MTNKTNNSMPKQNEVLYHYTCPHYVEAILDAGYINTTASNLGLDKANLYPVVWLADSPSPDNLGLFSSSKIPDELDKTFVRITVAKKPYMKHWEKWSKDKGRNEEWTQALITAPCAESTSHTWYVSERKITFEDILLIENLQTGEIYFDSSKSDKKPAALEDVEFAELFWLATLPPKQRCLLLELEKLGMMRENAQILVFGTLKSPADTKEMLEFLSNSQNTTIDDIMYKVFEIQERNKSK